MHIKMLKTGKRFNKELTPYLCKRCGEWHTTSMSKASSKRLDKRLSEILRRVEIVKAIHKNPTVCTVLGYQESWMVLDVVNMVLICNVFDKEKVIKIEGY